MNNERTNRLLYLAGTLIFTAALIIPAYGQDKQLEQSLSVKPEQLVFNPAPNFVDDVCIRIADDALKSRPAQVILNDSPLSRSSAPEDIIEADVDEEESLVIEAEVDISSIQQEPPVPVEHIVDEKSVPNGADGCKSYNFTYMDWRKVTCKSAPQYHVLNAENAWTNEKTGIRMVDDRICIAIGLGYGFSPGDRINVHLTNGEVVKCIIGDMKAPMDCDETNRFQATDGSVVEIIIDGRYFYSTKQYPDALSGTVETLTLVEV